MGVNERGETKTSSPCTGHLGELLVSGQVKLLPVVTGDHDVNPKHWTGITTRGNLGKDTIIMVYMVLLAFDFLELEKESERRGPAWPD